MYILHYKCFHKITISKLEIRAILTKKKYVLSNLGTFI